MCAHGVAFEIRYALATQRNILHSFQSLKSI